MNNDLEFDLIDDLIEFINNDTTFYKEVYYPLVQKLRDNYKTGASLKKASFISMVKRAYELYKETYDVDQLPDTLSSDTVHDICNKLYQQEIDDIEKEKSPDNEILSPIDPVTEEINDIAKLAGVYSSPMVSIKNLSAQAAENASYMKEHNIQPGTKEWFDLWFKLDCSRVPVGFRGRK